MFPLLGELFSLTECIFHQFLFFKVNSLVGATVAFWIATTLYSESVFFLIRKISISMHPLSSNTLQLCLFLFPKVKHIRQIQMLHLKHIPPHSLGSLFPINVKHVLFRHVLRAWEFLQGHNTTLTIYMLTLLLRPRAKHL